MTPPSATTTPVVIIRPSGGGPPYVRCTSSDSFVNPLANPLARTAKEINATLNLNLGLALINPDNVVLRKTLRFLMKFLLMWWEHYFFALLDAVPLFWRQQLTAGAWNIYLPPHKLVIGHATGIHPDASPEYHALTTIMWWDQLFPVTDELLRLHFDDAHHSPASVGGRSCYDDNDSGHVKYDKLLRLCFYVAHRSPAGGDGRPRYENENTGCVKYDKLFRLHFDDTHRSPAGGVGRS
mmetsp:Transcript_24658/g.29773  ORF Transcript_24658/g.29773 Transcript_24658/m.29773 type:complete len:238 (-) Transcript_24658:71-784(-)